MNKTVFCCFLVGVLLSALAVECSAQSHFVRFSLDEAYIGEYPPRKIGVFFALSGFYLRLVWVTVILGVTSFWMGGSCMACACLMIEIRSVCSGRRC